MHIEIVYLRGSGSSSSGMLKSLAAVTVASPADTSILSCDSVEGKAAWEVRGEGTGNLLRVVGLRDHFFSEGFKTLH